MSAHQEQWDQRWEHIGSIILTTHRVEREAMLPWLTDTVKTSLGTFPAWTARWPGRGLGEVLVVQSGIDTCEARHAAAANALYLCPKATTVLDWGVCGALSANLELGVLTIATSLGFANIPRVIHSVDDEPHRHPYLLGRPRPRYEREIVATADAVETTATLTPGPFTSFHAVRCFAWPDPIDTPMQRAWLTATPEPVPDVVVDGGGAAAHGALTALDRAATKWYTVRVVVDRLAELRPRGLAVIDQDRSAGLVEMLASAARRTVDKYEV